MVGLSVLADSDSSFSRIQASALLVIRSFLGMESIVPSAVPVTSSDDYLHDPAQPEPEAKTDNRPEVPSRVLSLRRRRHSHASDSANTLSKV